MCNKKPRNRVFGKNPVSLEETMFNEQNTVKAFVRDLLCAAQPALSRAEGPPAGRVAKMAPETRFFSKTWFLPYSAE